MHEEQPTHIIIFLRGDDQEKDGNSQRDDEKFHSESPGTVKAGISEKG